MIYELMVLDYMIAETAPFFFSSIMLNVVNPYAFVHVQQSSIVVMPNET